MPVLMLEYRHCRRMLPKYIRNSEIEEVAAWARRQLIAGNADALTLSQICEISGMKINGVSFDLYVGTENAVHDEDDHPVLGICEYDPGVPNTVMISVSPASEHASEELVLSTVGHELGHAIFDGPGWITDASKGPGLFDEHTGGRKAYRTTTRSSEHLSKSVPPTDKPMVSSPVVSSVQKDNEYFAELRANEFMGSLLVPRQRLRLAAVELAPEHGVCACHDLLRGADDAKARRAQSADSADLNALDSLKKALATRFGVTPRFIQVRMERYGLLATPNQTT